MRSGELGFKRSCSFYVICSHSNIKRLRMNDHLEKEGPAVSAEPGPQLTHYLKAEAQKSLGR